MLKSLIIGFSSANRSGKMILLLVIANILFTYPIATPILLLVVMTSNGHLAAERLRADKLDFNWLADLFNHQFPGASLESATAQFGILLLVMSVLYLLLNTLFAGGILGVLHSEDGQFTMRKFWMGCGAWFWRFFRLMLISLLFYVIAYGIFKLISAPINSSAETADEYAPIFYKRWIADAFLVLLFAYINMVFDYAKIGAVVNHSRGMLRETGSAFRFSLRRFFRAMTLYWLIAIIGIALFAFFVWLRGQIHQKSGGAVLLAMLVGQMAIAARMWTRLNFFASELDLFRRLAPVLTVAQTLPPIEFSPAVANPLATELPDPSSTTRNETEIVVQPEPEKL